MQHASTVAGFRLRRFLSLTKPRVVSLIVFCAVIGMLLAAPGWVPPKLLLAATIGIWLVAGAAALLGACPVSHRGFRQGRAPDAPGHARAPLHAALRAALHADPVRLGAAPVRLRNERLDLSRRGARVERRFRGLRGAALRRLQQCARAADLPLLDRVSRSALRRAAGRSLFFYLSAFPCGRCSRWFVSRWPLPAAAGRALRSRTPTSPAPITAGISR